MCNFHILCSCSKNCFSTLNLPFLGFASNLCDLANVPEVFDFLNFFLLPDKTDLGFILQLSLLQTTFSQQAGYVILLLLCLAHQTIGKQIPCVSKLIL